MPKKPKKIHGLDEICPACGKKHVGGGSLEDDSWWMDKAVYGSLSCFQTHQECRGCGHKWDFQIHPERQRIIDELERLIKGRHKTIDVKTFLAFVKGEIPETKI
jgi:hypothetical protein